MSNLLNTELPKRFTDAIGKLYVAVHNGKLNAQLVIFATTVLDGLI